MSQELTVHQSNVVNLRKLAESPAYQNRFRQVLNDRAPQFVASLVQVVASSEYLAKCDPNTIMAAAITAAVLDLPIDKNLGFAHIVPYGADAQFQMGYKGFIQLAIRTGQYRFLNCCVVREGELQKYDELSGEVVIDASKRVKDGKVIGYAGYFKLMNGYEHAEFWTREEVEEHAKKFSQAYKSGRNTPWKTDFDAMALKTVIKSLLSHWGIMSIEMQRALVSDQGVRKSLDTDEVAYPDNEPKRPSQDGPPEIEVDATKVTDPEVAKAAADAIQAGKIDKPHEHLQGLIKAAKDVNDDQVLAWLKGKQMAKPESVELLQATDSNLRKLIGIWPTALVEIRKIQI